MIDTLRKEFEVTYRACFPIAAELQPNLFSFELDDDEYVEAKVHVAFTLWQAARATVHAPDVWTVIAPDGRKWQDPSLTRVALRARFATGDLKQMLNNIQTALSDVPDTEAGQCMHCGHVEASRATAEQSRSDARPVAVTAPVPTERGIYAWIAEGSASLVLVHTRPSDHSPGGIMKATNIRNCTFYEECPVEQWHGGTWYGPLTKDALKSQQDAAIEAKPAEQSAAEPPTRGYFHAGVIVKLLLDDAFEILRPNSPEDCPEEPHMRVALGKKYWAILTATPRSIESQRGDGS